MFGVSGLLLFLAGALVGASSILLLMVYTLIIKTIGVLFDGKVQHSITSNLRATITSVSLFAIEVLSIGTYLLYGLLSRHDGNFAAFKAIGIGVAVIAAGYLLVSPRGLNKMRLLNRA